MARRTGRLRAWSRGLAFALLALLLPAGGYAGWYYLTGNVHAVIEGELYRSATLSPGRLTDVIATHGIRTIVNLRGAAESQAWYREESRIAAAAGIRLIDLPWSARRELTDAQVATFLAEMKDAPRPVLIHCRSGSDRTGLASALYLAALKKADEVTAEAQLSLRYGHFGLPFMPYYAMDATFDRLEPSFGYPAD
ncbi:tyrosine-protein phosphatase [Ancylobacter lacus]|uniref:tyrosine-protein phosphatase n=1 Tax=Ancylobacter lacus TaxID=2579970 RepID=UPI001BD060FB|nr:tyrosine-protein phosphatase [Ancylobacter lacus]MBS7538103.1 tyrosine-protein phosphatase [Ancylobacter lacus]